CLDGAGLFRVGGAYRYLPPVHVSLGEDVGEHLVGRRFGPRPAAVGVGVGAEHQGAVAAPRVGRDHHAGERFAGGVDDPPLDDAAGFEAELDVGGVPVDPEGLLVRRAALGGHGEDDVGALADLGEFEAPLRVGSG